MMRAAAGALLLVMGGCATMEEVDQLRRRTVLLETRVQELESKQQSRGEQLEAAIESSSKKASAEARAIRETVASMGARQDSLGDRVTVLESRAADVNTTASRFSANAQRIDSLEATLTDLQAKLTEMEKSRAAAPATGAADDAALYQKALELFNAGKYDEATAGFEHLLRARPDSKYVSNAHFWIGESHFRKEKYLDALRRYTTVLKEYPESPKFCAAGLKSGLALEKIGEAKQARVFYNQVVQKCREQDPPVFAEAERRLKENP